ncbi:hypothetical protein Ddc_13426 [Ditylenchus destructor]|nr:hypothetical protein Ddc_13426 [Ditylenchus destructor]
MEVYLEQPDHDKKKRYEGSVNENCLEVSSQSSSPPVATIMAQNASGSHIIQPTCLPQPSPPTRELLYKGIKLENTFQSLLSARKKEWENASKKIGDNVGLQMAASTFYYTHRLIQIFKYKSEAALAQGIVPELNDEHGIYCTQLRTVLPISLPTSDGIDVENATLSKYFDGSLVLELNYFNYGKYEEWPVDFLGKHMGAYDFIKIISEEGCSALRKDCLITLVRVCQEFPKPFLDIIPPCFIIGFRPALDWRSEVFERFRCQEENMMIGRDEDGLSVRGATALLSTVNHNGVEMDIYIYFGFENENEPYTNISCFEIFRVPAYL